MNCRHPPLFIRTETGYENKETEEIEENQEICQITTWSA